MNDLYCMHPKLPALHVHGDTEHQTTTIEGVASVETLVVQDEFHTHSPWLGGFLVKGRSVALKAAHTNHIIWTEPNASISLPTFKPTTPLLFQLQVEMERKDDIVVRLPESYSWSTASWCLAPSLNVVSFGASAFSVASSSDGVCLVVTIQSRAMCEDGNMQYVLQCKEM
jgi:hypothetical protein